MMGWVQSAFFSGKHVSHKSATFGRSRSSTLRGAAAGISLPMKESLTDSVVRLGTNDSLFLRRRSGTKKAGISSVTWHTLRHTFASRLVNRGVDIGTVKELLGHSTVTVTMRYAHTNMASKRDAVKNLVPSCDNLVTMPRKSTLGLQTVTMQV